MTAGFRDALALALVGLWLGAAAIVAASVAPAAFAALPSRSMAGNVVGRVLPVVFIAGIALGSLAAVLQWQASRVRGGLAGAVAVACIAAQFVIGPRIARLRAEIGPALDALSTDDPRRVAFGRLHALSVGWMGLAMLAAIIFTILALRAAQQRS